MTVRVRHLDAASCAAWDAFVAQHPDGTFCHRAGWKKVIEAGAGHESPFLVAEQDGSLVGVLPLTLRRSLLFGKQASSTMFGVYGGPLAGSDEAYDALDEAAWNLARDAGCDTLEYRTIRPRHQATEGWQTVPGKAATFIRDLASGDEQDILLQIPRKQRAVVRKSLKQNIVSDWNAGIDEFYQFYAYSVHGLGTPVFPKRLFTAFKAVFEDDVLVQVIRDAGGKGVASLMSFRTRDTVLPFYAGGSAQARSLAAHDFMYFELMKRAQADGLSKFDFGRSKIGTGPFNFKKNWGFEPTPLEYEYRLAPGANVPDISPQNRKFSLVIEAWKRLPLGVANLIGPPIAKHLG
ncbi:MULTISPECIES: FemAB family XrtA/PEP-CTERM system-associated protein [Kordiimonas]|jgi:FemAB-related protein (PEP-CTERM system-associated)|uniref:FemAB family XrtA/PEP-CTERM system-associated protein n=1 Tax=Kordiimonas TaxID=288021 RepID=UPI00257B4520|nr:FemAB family XrtA/PEP-CTERM system-associated protein [Kordiimonas sp. UBA4487]